MKIAIVGSRTFNLKQRNEQCELSIRAFVGSLPKDTIIISGGADGVDTWAENAARECGLTVEVCIPEWDRYQPEDSTKKNPAGMIRNRLMVRDADKVVAFWDMHSNGTRGTIKEAKRTKKPLTIFNHEGKPIGDE